MSGQGAASVLVVEDESGIRAGLSAALARAGHRAVTAASLGEARARLAEPTALDCALVDIRLKDGSGLDLLREMRGGPRRAVPVIMATAFDDGERVIEAMRDGAFDYLTKPFDLTRLLSAVERAVRAHRVEASVPSTPDDGGAMVGRSAAMLGVWKTIGRAAASRAPMLIRGESGVGKELVARVVHEHAAGNAPLHWLRVDGRTGADALRTDLESGREGATLVLDGVGELASAAQLAVASFLASPLLASQSAPRVLAIARTERGASATPLLPELYYPLAVLEVEVPPLRERRSDIPLLAARALSGTAARAVSEGAMAALARYDWPGNVRELFLVVRRAAAMCRSDVVDSVELPDEAGSEPTSEPPSQFAGLPLREALARLERDLLIDALRRAEGNRTLAAKLLGIPRPQLYAKLEEHGHTLRRPRGAS